MKISSWITIGRRWVLSPQLALVCRLVLGGIFLYAGWSKLSLIGELRQSIEGFAILPDFLVRPCAQILPWVELLSGALLIGGLLVPSAGALLTLLNGMFLVAIGVALWRGSSVDCGCFGQREPLSWWVFTRDVGFLLLSLQVLAAKQQFFSLDRSVAALWRRRSGRQPI